MLSTNVTCIRLKCIPAVLGVLHTALKGANPFLLTKPTSKERRQVPRFNQSNHYSEAYSIATRLKAMCS